MKYTEGYMPFYGHKTYYRIYGESTPGKYPLVLLHGGPGALHNYLLSMKGIAEYGRQVIFYDQIGCGKSPAELSDEELTPDLFCDELDALRAHLHLDKVHLLGQSCGGVFTQHYMLFHGEPEGVLSITLASSLPSMRLWGEEGQRLIFLLPEHMQSAIKEGFEKNDFTSPAYKEAEAEYYRRHVCSIVPWPEDVRESFENEARVYQAMQGRCEFDISGNLMDWSAVDDLHRIRVPALIIHGNNDESTPYLNKIFHDRIPDNRWVIIQNGTHLCHQEFPELFNSEVEKHLEASEAGK